MSLKEFEENLVDIFHIFNQLSQNKFLSQSMSKIQTELSNRNHNNSYNLAEDPKYIKRDKNQEFLLLDNFVFSQEWDNKI